MLKTVLKLVLGSVLLITAQACAPGQPPPDLNAINTAIAQTLAATTQMTEPGIPVTGDESPTPTVTVAVPMPTSTTTSTMTVVVPTPTTTAIVLPSPVFTVTPAFTPAVAHIRVSVPTNCRVGPGRVYDRVGGLQVGEVAEVVGQSANRNYWIIRDPSRTNVICWLWGEYATVTGNTAGLPVYAVPPTPTPAFTSTPTLNFDVAYNNLESCTGTGWWVDFELENHGSIGFNSVSLTVRDTSNNTVVSLYANDFTNRDGCNESETWDNLPASEELLLSSPVFTSDPRGHALRATVTLCTNTDQSGMCTTESLTFTP